MNNKIAVRIGIGVFLYAVFVVAVLMFYPDKPQDMDWKDREEYNKIQITKIELGLKKQDILALLMQVMFYRTQHKQADGITTVDECTPLLFVNDQLIAWGDSAYQSYIDG